MADAKLIGGPVPVQIGKTVVGREMAEAKRYPRVGDKVTFINHPQPATASRKRDRDEDDDFVDVLDGYEGRPVDTVRLSVGRPAGAEDPGIVGECEFDGGTAEGLAHQLLVTALHRDV